LTFAPGETQKTVAVSVVGDPAAEPDETLVVKISDPVNATIAKDTGTGTIANDDVAPKSGHYHGSNTQNHPVDFDVSPDLTTISKFVMNLDVFCPGIGTLHGVLNLGSGTIPIDANYGFATSLSGGSGGYTESIGIKGSLIAPNTASGTIQVDITFDTGAQVIQCGGSGSWSATATS
jgi:hypothetical protein